jgi:hypothetical protein
MPPEMRWRLLTIPDQARSMGIHIMAGRGSGKSRLMGGVIAWLDFVRGVPLVVLDPAGPSIDNFLNKLVRLPRADQERLWRRVVYVDMSGRVGYVTPFPLYYRLGQESLYEIAQRYLDVVRKIDPHLATASVEGWNALWRIGTYAGMVLTALDCQITEAEGLLSSPAAWMGKFPAAVQTYPEVRPAVEFFTEQFLNWEENVRGRRTDSFLNKVAWFRLDPTMRAMFGAKEVGIDWRRVIQERQAVLLDFRHEYDLERRRFKMLWAFTYFLDFIKQRGAGRHQPVSVIIDELTSLLNTQVLGVNPFVADLDELINVIARNYRVWLTIAHQELYQLDERLQKTLMSMGTQILGTTSDMDAALFLARHLYRVNPYQVKRYEPIYNSFMGRDRIIDHRAVDFTVEEQHYQHSYEFKDRGLFRFLVRPAPGEGETSTYVYPVTIRNFDRGVWVNEELVGQARALLSQRSGVPIETALAEIEARQNAGALISAISSVLPQPNEEAGTMATDGNNRSESSIPVSDDDDAIFWEKA